MKMYRELVTKFDKKRRCVICDITLSTSKWDSKPLAVQIKKRRIDQQTTSGTNRGRKNYQCITCAIKGKSVHGCHFFKLTIEEIIKFFHLEAKNA